MNGPDLLDALLSVRRFHQQCRLLLGTVDAHLIHTHGLTKLAANQAAIETSYSLEHPDKWQPDVLFRWFHVPNAPAQAACVALHLMPRTQPEPGVEPFTEPLACAVILDFDQPIQAFKPLWYARAALWMPGARDAWSRWEAPPGTTGTGGQIRARLRAVPLARLHSTDDLVTHVLDPLIAELGLIDPPR